MNRKLFLTLASASVLGVAMAAPAQAQVYRPAPTPRSYQDQRYVDSNIRARIQRAQMRLDLGIRQGTISPREAWPLRAQLRELTRLEAVYSRNGLDRREEADLEYRLRGLRDRVRMADGRGYDRYDRNNDGGDDRYDRNRDGRDDRNDRNADGRDDRYDRNADGRDDRYDRNNDGRDDRYDRNADGNDDRYDRNGDDIDDRYDRNNDGYDDRDLNRNGRWDDDRSGGMAGLQVGQRATADLGALPIAYRMRFRDADGAYFRSDGRLIYEIDARSNTVIRVYPMDR